MSTRPSWRRRPSDVATDLFKSLFARFLRSDDKARRSLSTGDLADKPIPEESDYFEMDFTPKPTTSAPLDPSFDDCDRVPMKFDSKGGRLLPQYRKSVRRLARSGSTESLENFSDADIALSQPWFYNNIDSHSAEAIIRAAGAENGLFLVHFLYGSYQLVICHKGKIHHLRIFCREKRQGKQTKWCLGMEKRYRNLADLVEHYHRHKGFVLPTKLKNPCSRPLRYGTASRSRA